jgi:hypothetical protein
METGTGGADRLPKYSTFYLTTENLTIWQKFCCLRHDFDFFWFIGFGTKIKYPNATSNLEMTRQGSLLPRKSLLSRFLQENPMFTASLLADISSP